MYSKSNKAAEARRGSVEFLLPKSLNVASGGKILSVPSFIPLSLVPKGERAGVKAP